MEIRKISLGKVWFGFLGMGQILVFYDNWMEDSPLINKIQSNTFHHIQDIAKVNDFITPSNTWDMQSLIDVLPIKIINKIKAIFVPIADV